MKQRTLNAAVLAGMAALISGPAAHAAETPAHKTPDKPQAAASRDGREALVRDALAAVHKSVQNEVRARDEDNIPRRFWGQALQKLRPRRVVNDRMNVRIVLTEDSRYEKGLYVTNPISSYAISDTDPRFAAFAPLSRPGDKSFGQLYRYQLRKQTPPAHPRQAKPK